MKLVPGLHSWETEDIRCEADLARLEARLRKARLTVGVSVCEG
jgi:hypothetical protein